MIDACSIASPHGLRVLRYPVLVQPAVFLDRSKTLIADEEIVGDFTEVQLREGVAVGLRRLREAGFRIVVIANQPAVAHGECSEQDVDAAHLRIAELVDEQAQCRNLIERFYYCPYHPEASVPEFRRDHPWRLPHPGMMIQAARDLGLDLHRSWLISSNTSDVRAGRAAGCRTILIRTDHHENGDAPPHAAVESFDEAVDAIIHETAAHTDFAHGNETANGYDARGGAHEAPNHDPVALNALLTELANIRRTMFDLSEDIRAEHVRRSEFTPLRLAAGVAQLLVLLLAMLGLMQLGETEAFVKWMLGAGLVQLLTIAILVADLRG